MKAIVKATAEAGVLSVTDVPTPRVGDGDVLVKVRATGICYTDVTVLQNKYIGRRPVPIPMVMGHEGAGEIVEIGNGVSAARVGQRVALEPIAGCGHCRQCLTGHQNLCTHWEHIGLTRDGTFGEYIAIPSKQAHRIDDSVGFDTAALTEPFGLVVRTLEQVKPIVGESAAIIGPGPIGILHLLAFLAAGIRNVTMVGLSQDAQRFEIARKIGAAHIIRADVDNPVEAIKDYTAGEGADIVVETASSPKATSLAFDLVGPLGRVSLFGLYPSAEFSPLQILRKGVTTFGDVAQLTRHFIQAIQIMGSGVIDFAPVITHRKTVEEAESAFMATREGDAMKVLFEFS